TAIEGTRVSIAGTDVTDMIRTPDIDRVVSSVARHPSVRAILRERQRALADAGNAVMEGRDIGSVVYPQAEVKVYLVAAAAERARRRTAERPGVGADALATDLRLRDARDSKQTLRAPDAEEIDTTELGVDEVVERIERMVAERTAATR
ncbi:MAG: (d)CMP kinase, partial [Actinobacteria bacterium]|nr:(d)CMP kinase [Actinomycetota bacterium]